MNNTGRTTLTFLTGLGIGTALAVLFAPQSGEGVCCAHGSSMVSLVVCQRLAYLTRYFRTDIPKCHRRKCVSIASL